MPDTPSIVINKTFTYRGVPEEWSNKYHFLGSTPGTVADWKTLAVAIWNAERTFLHSDVKFNGFLGYDAGDKTANAIVGPDDLTTAEKTAGAIGGTRPSGDVAATIRWATGLRGAKGRPIFCRKFFHGVPGDGGDPLISTVLTNMTAYGNLMKAGTLPGGAKISTPQGTAGGTVRVAPNYTTRTLKRRGKSPN